MSAPVARNYTLRLTSTHGADNQMTGLSFELQREGEDWESHVPTLHTSPFLDFLFDAFRCQLAYLRMNATERGLGLARVHGLARVDTEDFVLGRLDVGFAMELSAGEPGADDLAYLAERCLLCPVSRNLPHVTRKRTVVVTGTRVELPG